jgi:hypothetical protein
MRPGSPVDASTGSSMADPVDPGQRHHHPCRRWRHRRGPRLAAIAHDGVGRHRHAGVGRYRPARPVLRCRGLRLHNRSLEGRRVRLEFDVERIDPAVPRSRTCGPATGRSTRRWCERDRRSRRPIPERPVRRSFRATQREAASRTSVWGRCVQKDVAIPRNGTGVSPLQGQIPSTVRRRPLTRTRDCSAVTFFGSAFQVRLLRGQAEGEAFEGTPDAVRTERGTGWCLRVRGPHGESVR